MAYKAPQTWEECGRDDLNMIPTMAKHGFNIEFDHNDVRWNRTTPQNCPHGNVTFSKGNLHVWKAYKPTQESIGAHWKTADLIDGHYVNHNTYENLSDLFGN
jgi:hypothetical protein